MHKSRSMILGLALALAVPAAVMAQTPERSTNSGDARNVTCRVTNLNSTEKSFTADCPEGQMTFITTSSTQFTRSTSGASGGGASASMSDIKVGDQVRVTYSGQAAGTGTGTGATGSGMKHTATRVEIMPAGASQPGSQSGSGASPGTQSASQSGSSYSQPGSAANPAETQYGAGLAGSTSSTSSQYGSQQPNRVEGRVASVDRENRTLVIETDKGRETFKVDQSNTSVNFASIREGEHVEITFSGSGADRRITSLRTMPENMAQQRTSGTEQRASQPASTSTSASSTQHASQQTGSQYGSQPATQKASQQQGQQNRVTGRIVSVEDKKLVIESSRGRETFLVDPASATVDLSRFQEGDQVTVMYAGTGNDRKITSIQASAAANASQRGSSDAQPAGQHLPKTASEVPFIGLVGLFMLAAAFGLRYVRRHV